jgi:hypothetical protein
MIVIGGHRLGRVDPEAERVERGDDRGHVGRGGDGQVDQVLRGDGAVTVPQHLRPARLHPVDRLGGGAALARLVVGDPVDVGHAGLQLHDRRAGPVALLAAAGAVSEADVVLPGGRDHPVRAVAEPDHSGQRVDRVVPVPRAGLVEVRHRIP